MDRPRLEEQTIRVRPARDERARAAIARLGELIQGIRVAMVTTTTPRGHLRSRPMMTQDSELDDELWFYIDWRSAIVDDITEHHQVGIVYTDQGKDRYVSVSGIGQVLKDQEQLVRHWNSRAAEWFPAGLEDPNLGLLRVQLEEAEYWDVAARSMVKLFGLDASDEREVPVTRPRPPYEAPAEG